MTENKKYEIAAADIEVLRRNVIPEIKEKIKRLKTEGRNYGITIKEKKIKINYLIAIIV